MHRYLKQCLDYPMFLTVMKTLWNMNQTHVNLDRVYSPPLTDTGFLLHVPEEMSKTIQL